MNVEDEEFLAVLARRKIVLSAVKLSHVFGLGSISDYIIHHANVPVMVVKLAEDDLDSSRFSNGDSSKGSAASSSRGCAVAPVSMAP
eukprot:5506141-Pyramimonas_sp.AAC.1